MALVKITHIHHATYHLVDLINNSNDDRDHESILYPSQSSRLPYIAIILAISSGTIYVDFHHHHVVDHDIEFYIEEFKKELRGTGRKRGGYMRNGGRAKYLRRV